MSREDVQQSEKPRCPQCRPDGPGSLEKTEIKIKEMSLKHERCTRNSSTDESDKNESSDSSDSDADCIDDELLSVGSTGAHIKCIKDTPDGKRKAMAVAQVTPKSFAHRVGIQKGDCIDSVNDQTFSKPDDLCNFVQKCEETRTLSIKISRQVYDSRTGSSGMKVIVINKVYATLTEQCHCSSRSSFQYDYEDEKYLRLNIGSRSFYVTVRNKEKELHLKRYRRIQKKRKAVWKVHHFRDTTGSAISVVLQHKKSKLCVKLTQNGVVMVTGQPTEDCRSPADPRVLSMVREASGYAFKSCHVKKFLGFSKETGSKWGPAVISSAGLRRDTGQDNENSESAATAVFQLFLAKKDKL